MVVELVATGGTIASRHTDAGVVASVTGRELLDALGAALPQSLTLKAQDVGVRGSYALTLEDMKAIADAAIECCTSGADGVVVTHGTDSMEETAFLVDLLHEGDEPVVFTGAQRPFDDPAGDGSANLALAISTAADATHRGRGVMVAFADGVMPAVGVRKVSTEGLRAFANTMHSAQTPWPRSSIAGAAAGVADKALAPVTVVAAVPGGDGRALRDACAHAPAGIVFQALGIGNVSLHDAEAVAEATAAGIPVLVTSRVQQGQVKAVYGNGGGKALEEAGAVFAGALSTWQARILLSVSMTLSRTTGLDDAARWLRHHTAPQ
ncbi:asparaginase [Pedococcus sp. NPDC057267]|uniref:asparaginase n=1 Tax=Pedococcus sp. NPDC057267 TaxID=3346077 RepID=UPI00364468DD